MHWNTFSIVGYLSVALWLVVPVLLALHQKRRPRRWLCHVALALALAAYGLAKINSVTHVNRIQVDQSAEVVAGQENVIAARKTVEQVRQADVAQIRFAEDATGDFLDKGGMDASDLKYVEKVSRDAEPAWKKGKEHRSGGTGDNSLEAAIGAGGKAGTGVPDVSRTGNERAPTLMLARDRDRANRLDAANLLLIRFLILAALITVVLDYLRRANIYEEAYLPLPLPSSWVNGLTPLPPVAVQPVPARRTPAEELAWLSRRGDAFVYMARDAAAAEAIPAVLPRLGRRGWPMEVIHINAGSAGVSDAFVFESLWYNRASFVFDSPVRAEAFLAQLAGLLRRRKATGASVRQTVHVVWDAGKPLPDELRTELMPLAHATGWSVLEVAADCNRPQPETGA